MDATTRTALHKSTQGLLSSLLLSVMVALCASTPIPPEQLHPRRHYERLVRDTHVLDSHHLGVYTSFKTVRYEEVSIRIDDFRINGVPTINDLPPPLERYSMQESELLPIHYTRLHAFEPILARAIEDEFQLRMEGESNFYDQMRSVLTLLQRTISKLRQTMISRDIDHDFEAAPATVVFTNSESRTYLNIRILYILQEFKDNLTPALEDFVHFMNQLEEPSS